MPVVSSEQLRARVQVSNAAVKALYFVVVVVQRGGRGFSLRTPSTITLAVAGAGRLIFGGGAGGGAGLEGFCVSCRTDKSRAALNAR